jgi:hypothetical protein
LCTDYIDDLFNVLKSLGSVTNEEGNRKVAKVHNPKWTNWNGYIVDAAKMKAYICKCFITFTFLVELKPRKLKTYWLAKKHNQMQSTGIREFMGNRWLLLHTGYQNSNLLPICLGNALSLKSFKGKLQ